ncbi:MULTISPECIES: AAA family ATPase [unclassified Marinobacter]|uniref:AAA family ATPase n=1 Tax=unclassified Marinobacter TaxID=83889 RepID=UPI000BF97765|nr:MULTISPECIES: AAA family ATPase [unclassified Marinobacter]PFG08401.1 AAA domain-containing protein [Marinobacter sp. LV10MA510-1]PFG54200.1 AAA domain-containing protein [Marinobacter sp. LV10R520-4]
MKLESVRVEQFKQFKKPFLLNGLSDGINVISGPNEAGKSTLVRAIRAAFFERHRSKAAEDLRPWGDSSAAPAIELVFHYNGQNWQLNKSFLQRKRCDLSIQGTTYSGEEAEEKLAQLLGYQFPKKGASKEEHWGIPGLLWVEQGSGQNIEQAVVHAGDHLQSALNSLVSEVVSEGGDGLIHTVRQQLSELLTAGGAPRGEYKQLLADELPGQQELDALETRIEQYQNQVDRLAKVALEFHKIDREQPWIKVRQALAEAQERYRQIESLQGQQQTLNQALTSVQQRAALLQRNKQQVQADGKQLQQREQEHNTAQQALNDVQASAAGLHAALEQCQSQYRDALEVERQAGLLETRQRLEHSSARAKTQLQQLSERKSRAAELQQALGESRKLTARHQISKAAVDQLRTTQRQLDDARLRSQAIATRIEWQLEAGQQIELGQDTLPHQGEQLLLSSTRLRIVGVGEFTITPGGDDLARCQRQLEQLQLALGEQLQALGVADLAAADHTLVAQERAQADVHRMLELLQSLVPGGLASLDSDYQALSAELARNCAEKEALAPATTLAKGLPALAKAQDLRSDAENRLSAAEKRFGEHEKALLAASHRYQNADHEWHTLRASLNSEQRQQEVTQLNSDLIAVEQEQAGQQGRLQQMLAQIAAARPELVQQDIQRLGASADQLEQAQRGRELELKELRARLEIWGAEGLEEQRGRCLAELEQNRRRCQQLQRRAEALQLLLQLLTEKRQALTQRLQAPLQKHLNHYVTVLFPDAQLEVDSQLLPGRFTRDGETGQMAELSFGAREQMGLISRLAYADLLKEADKPTLIILDDSLVHSDSVRLDSMKRILFDAAQRHQILLFTCHPDNWQDMGSETINLEALKARAVL